MSDLAAEVEERLDVGQALASAATRLQAEGVEGARRDARLLLARVLDVPIEAILARPERPLTVQQAAAFEAFVVRRGKREPLSRIFGEREFWGLRLRLSAATLDPRPDSETLIEAVLEKLPDRDATCSILDLGTGSGCLLLALLAELPNATGLGIDLDPHALETARDNACQLALADRTRFAAGDWGQALSGRWKVIVSNPPYITDRVIDSLAPEVALYEPRRALQGGSDGLSAYRSLAPQLRRLLAPNGLAVLEVGAGQAAFVEDLLTAAGLVLRGRRRDLAGHDRCVLATIAS